MSRRGTRRDSSSSATRGHVRLSVGKDLGGFESRCAWTAVWTRAIGP